MILYPLLVPAGSDGQVHYNNGGLFGADSAFTFNDTTKVLTVAGDIITGGNLIVPDDGTTGNADNYWQYHDDVDYITSSPGSRVGIGISPLYSLDVDEIGNSAGDLKLQADVQGNVVLFNDTDIGDGVDGKKFIIHRRTSGGDARAEIFISEYQTFNFRAIGGSVNIEGNTARLQAGGNGGVTMFDVSGEGSTEELEIYGFRTGDIKRILQIGVGVDANDTASFDGLSNYYFDGSVGIGVTDPHSKLEVGGAISSATLTITASSDTTDVSGINTLFVDTTSGDVTLGGLVGGVDGQHLMVLKIVAANDLILEHEEGIGGDTDDLFMHQLGDEIIDVGGVPLIYNGTTGKWYDCSHAKPV